MKYVIFYSTKGGVGKSTFSKISHIVLAMLERRKVTGEDLDPQQHYADFLAANEALISTSEEADFYLYDTQGAHTQTNADLMAALSGVDSVIIVPVKPSNEDIKEAKRIAKRFSEYNLTDKVVYVLNDCHHSKDYTKYINELKQLGRVAKKRINNRTGFRETPTRKELNDFSQLLHEVVL